LLALGYGETSVAIARESNLREQMALTLNDLVMIYNTLGRYQEAAAALDEVNRDYERHCRAARRFAEEHFAADRVLERLCREADL